MTKSANAIAGEKEARIERRPGVVEVWMNVVRSHFTPDIVTAKVGDKVIRSICDQGRFSMSQRECRCLRPIIGTRLIATSTIHHIT